MNHTVDWYIDRALDSSGAPSDRELSRRLGLGPTAINNYRIGRAWPSDEAMVKLAELAGVDPDIALLELNSWRAKEEAVRKRYSRLAKVLEKAGAMVAATAIFIGTLLSAPTTEALERDGNRLMPATQEVYIIRQCGSFCSRCVSVPRPVTPEDRPSTLRMPGSTFVNQVPKCCFQISAR